MQRLLMGEVGSGKTVVALYAMLRAVESGAQAALMAPTETLAEQHFATLQALMPGALVQAALLTGSTPGGAAHGPARQARLRRAEAAGRDTCADPGRLVEFKRLTLAVIDEQHRFGVKRHRHALVQKGRNPHLFSDDGDADPTLARANALRRPGHVRSSTRYHPAASQSTGAPYRPRSRPELRGYKNFVKDQIDLGRQAFVICPLVDESEKIKDAATTAEYERLGGNEVFP